MKPNRELAITATAHAIVVAVLVFGVFAAYKASELGLRLLREDLDKQEAAEATAPKTGADTLFEGCSACIGYCSVVYTGNVFYCSKTECKCVFEDDTRTQLRWGAGVSQEKQDSLAKWRSEEME